MVNSNIQEAYRLVSWMPLFLIMNIVALNNSMVHAESGDKYRDLEKMVNNSCLRIPTLEDQGINRVVCFHDGNATGPIVGEPNTHWLSGINVIAFGDLNDDGEIDAVAVVNTNIGGTGWGTDIVALINNQGKFVYSKGYSLGEAVINKSDVKIVKGKVLIHYGVSCLNDVHPWNPVSKNVKLKLNDKNRLVVVMN